MMRAGRLFDLLEKRWVLIRLALTAPRIIDAGLGVVATLFAIALTWVYNTAESRESTVKST